MTRTRATAIGFGAVMTLFLPSRVSLVTDSVGVEGTIVSAPRSDFCGENRCFYADVRYPDGEGNTWTKRMRVPADATVGSIVPVRLPEGDPTEASTDSAFSAWIGLLYTVALGPVLLLGAGREALTRAWRRIRRIGEAG